MEIEIITTKKKLSLSLLKQMYDLPYPLFKHAKVLGYVSVGRKCSNKLALCKVDNEYYLHNMLWEKRKDYVRYNLAGHRGEFIKKINKNVIDDWFDKHIKICNEAKRQGHIYI